jgi:hypothetical protein
MNSEMAMATRALLHNRPRSMSYRDITVNTGIDDEWLTRFSTGRMPNPKIVELERLYKFLSGRTTLGL